MKTSHSSFDEKELLHDLKHYLPSQAPLKDFIHHNSLHAFQHLKFFDAIRTASQIFGYKVSLSLHEFRDLYQSGQINPVMLDKVISRKKGGASLKEWKDKLLNGEYNHSVNPRIGLLRSKWKQEYFIDMDLLVHPILFRILCSYLDQGISIWGFPVHHRGFLSSLRELEKNSFTSFFKNDRAHKFLLDEKLKLTDLLRLLIGDEKLYSQYLFDQQFAHQGWSGIVSVVEDSPDTLSDHRRISLHDIIMFELLLEIDNLDTKFGPNWAPLSTRLNLKPVNLFAPVPSTELSEVMTLWQEAFEWTYYEQVLVGIQSGKKVQKITSETSFQALFCIDDRECSIRRHLEKQDKNCETFGTPGFFGVEFYYKPEHANSITKQCPAPVTPGFLIKEIGKKSKIKTEAHFTKQTHSLVRGWLMSQTLGFWSAIRLFSHVFRPTMSEASVSSFRHMDKYSKLTVEYNPAHPKKHEHDLQIGFTVEEMAARIEGLLKSIGLVDHFASIVYLVGHGASSVNNTHYAGYDCGACSGRPGSVNARVASFMANHEGVRAILSTKGIHIPDSTRFIGALHDTTRDEIMFYDEDTLDASQVKQHGLNEAAFNTALDFNAKERSRRFVSVDSHQAPAKVHEKIRERSVALFEPRPELNHATNSLCIVGRRSLSKELFLDRRAFMNSYDHEIDPEGKYLFNILKAAAPVCGGINLEYYFSRVDNQKLGAGTKLPHNVMGLFGVANGYDGDLRPGLPYQMVEVHDPVRMLFIVEHYPEVVLQTIGKLPELYEWFGHEWVNLVAVHPETRELFLFRENQFEPYLPAKQDIRPVENFLSLFESHHDNLPVSLVS